jgi:YD repeat-containing protein
LLEASTPDGYRQVNRYDPKDGSLSKVAIRQGGHQLTIDFERGQPTAIRLFDGGEVGIAYTDGAKSRALPRTVRTPNGLELAYRYDARNRVTVIDCGAYRLSYQYDAQGRLVRLAQVSKQ